MGRTTSELRGTGSFYESVVSFDPQSGHQQDEWKRTTGCDLFDLAPDGRIRRKDSYRKIVG